MQLFLNAGFRGVAERTNKMTLVAIKPLVISEKEYVVEILNAEYTSVSNELTLKVRMHDEETGQTVITRYRFFNKGKGADSLSQFIYTLYGGYQDGFDTDELIGCQFYGKQVNIEWVSNSGIVRTFNNLVALSAGDFLEESYETEEDNDESYDEYEEDNEEFEFYEEGEDE